MAVCWRTSLATSDSTYSRSWALVIHCGMRMTMRPSTMRADTDLRRLDDRTTSTSMPATRSASVVAGARRVGTRPASTGSHSSSDHSVSTSAEPTDAV